MIAASIIFSLAWFVFIIPFNHKMTFIYWVCCVLLNLWWLDWEVLIYLRDITVIHLHIEGILSFVCCYIFFPILFCDKCDLLLYSGTLKKKERKKTSEKKSHDWCASSKFSLAIAERTTQALSVLPIHVPRGSALMWMKWRIITVGKDGH